MTTHSHTWKLSTHIDGCHWFRSAYACVCGATALSEGERDPTADPYALIGMEQTDDHQCARCAELIAGAAIRHSVKVAYPKDGMIEHGEGIA